ncbi:hypothetical protein ACFSJ3_07080 [Corallincola platygyrae]|uniref:UspA domain-containing protein n=1 Tax=Corallincola platygyrae TaxID=1193278 RepID=A0ABW4XN46_9GAMM
MSYHVVIPDQLEWQKESMSLLYLSPEAESGYEVLLKALSAIRKSGALLCMLHVVEKESDWVRAVEPLTSSLAFAIEARSVEPSICAGIVIDASAKNSQQDLSVVSHLIAMSGLCLVTIYHNNRVGGSESLSVLSEFIGSPLAVISYLSDDTSKDSQTSVIPALLELEEEGELGLLSLFSSRSVVTSVPSSLERVKPVDTDTFSDLPRKEWTHKVLEVSDQTAQSKLPPVLLLALSDEDKAIEPERLSADLSVLVNRSSNRLKTKYLIINLAFESDDLPDELVGVCSQLIQAFERSHSAARSLNLQYKTL